MSSEKNETREEPKELSPPPDFEEFAEYAPPRPTNIDPHYGRTIPGAGPSLLDLDPNNLPPPPPPPPRTIEVAPTGDLFNFSNLPPMIPQPLPPSSQRPSRMGGLSAKRARSPSTDDDDEEDEYAFRKGKKRAKPTPAKRAAAIKQQPSKKPLYKNVPNNRPMSKRALPTPRSNSGTTVKIPLWGIDFPRTGFAPSGSILKSGSLKGHFSKDTCRAAPPEGVTNEQWEKKFRSAESVLMKQLKKLHGNKEGKTKLDEMRDEGWVRDRALYLIETEKGKKGKEAEKQAEEEEKHEEEDTEMADEGESEEAEKEIKEEEKDAQGGDYTDGYDG